MKALLPFLLVLALISVSQKNYYAEHGVDRGGNVKSPFPSLSARLADYVREQVTAKCDLRDNEGEPAIAELSPDSLSQANESVANSSDGASYVASIRVVSRRDHSTVGSFDVRATVNPEKGEELQLFTTNPADAQRCPGIQEFKPGVDPRDRK